jgi:hypothetical protein
MSPTTYRIETSCGQRQELLPSTIEYTRATATYSALTNHREAEPNSTIEPHRL